MRIIVSRSFGTLTLLIGIILVIWIVYNMFSPTMEFKANFHDFRQLFMPVVLIFFGRKWMKYKGKGIEDITVDYDSYEIKESKQRAMGNLNWFMKQVNDNADEAYIKFPVVTPGGNTEHLWGYVHSLKDDHFNVSIINVPNDKKMDISKRRNIAKDDVEDWQIIYPDGTVKGAYSVIALFSHYESRGKKLSPLMREQKAALLDAKEAMYVRPR